MSIHHKVYIYFNLTNIIGLINFMFFNPNDTDNHYQRYSFTLK